ncbi:MAG TPA: YdeI/OmpD-associated family protein, partial [Patescibacteria group bacterium]|nr:YdeI/OmpD-associated family protein [Patescibacteria group bacterium]
MSNINFEAQLFKIGSQILLLLPKSASAKLPSRGMAMVEGTINGVSFQMPLEPDGRGSHWFKVNEAMRKAAKIDVGDTAQLSITPSKIWPEPVIPEDLEKALKSSPDEYTLWKNVTPIARWDWIRWISSTKNPETRKKRIEVELSKLKKGMKRPCCFNRS